MQLVTVQSNLVIFIYLHKNIKVVCETGIKGEEAWVDVPFTYYPNYTAYGENGTRLKTGIASSL